MSFVDETVMARMVATSTSGAQFVEGLQAICPDAPEGAVGVLTMAILALRSTMPSEFAEACADAENVLNRSSVELPADEIAVRIVEASRPLVVDASDCTAECISLRSLRELDDAARAAGVPWADGGDA